MKQRTGLNLWPCLNRQNKHKKIKYSKVYHTVLMLCIAHVIKHLILLAKHQHENEAV